MSEIHDWHVRDVLQLTHRLPPDEPEPKKVLPNKERAVKKAAPETAVAE